MASEKICIFCGAPRPRFGNWELVCGGVDQPTCKDCYYQYVGLSQEERCRVVLDTGRAKEPEAIRTFLDKLQAKAKAEREAVLTGLTCLRCGGTMLKAGRRKLQMGEETFFFDTHLFEGSLEVDILQCEQCRRLEFFAPGPEPEAVHSDDITCPDCGAKHSPLINCPTCALRDPRKYLAQKPSPAAKGPKPPWEK